MIIKFNKADGFILFDSVHQVERYYSSVDDAGSQHDHVLILDDQSKNIGEAVAATNVRVGFIQNAETWYVITDFNVYLMNDNGKTIDRY